MRNRRKHVDKKTQSFVLLQEALHKALYDDATRGTRPTERTAGLHHIEQPNVRPYKCVRSVFCTGQHGCTFVRVKTPKNAVRIDCSERTYCSLATLSLTKIVRRPRYELGSDT
ncbi:hypothetical protein PSPO01_15554 [Paraphaeosphaeria sporulosa]